MGIRFGLGSRLPRRAKRIEEKHTVDPAHSAAQLVDSVMTGAVSDLELIVQAARLVVSTRFATAALLVQRLHVTQAEANRILSRLVHCEVIAPSVGSKPHTVLTTSQQLPAVIEEFVARG